jgi:hypothetical protein
LSKKYFLVFEKLSNYRVVSCTYKEDLNYKAFDLVEISILVDHFDHWFFFLNGWGFVQLSSTRAKLGSLVFPILCEMVLFLIVKGGLLLLLLWSFPYNFSCHCYCFADPIISSLR